MGLQPRSQFFLQEESTMQYLTFRNQNSFGRDFDSLFGDLWRARAGEPGPSWVPATEVEEEEEGHFLLTLETPGMKQEELQIEVNENRLSVSGERQRHGKFSRVFTLPASADPAKIEAHYEDGVLKIFVPKAEAAKPRQVKIGAGQQEGVFAKLLGKKKEELVS